MLVVEHDEEAIRSADHVVDIGPGAGITAAPSPRAPDEVGRQPGVDDRRLSLPGAGRFRCRRTRRPRQADKLLLVIGASAATT